ncbi:hypothetical protein O7632_02415 [Solwaraspora sp. WMMD406]|uniref:hypothetical protein n=1 Tax=Solwaraspora sp. WMMD406 TaxID=3016095 RepID=UPI0024170272|nr:hypothetical protein [Solwaraspora sp. WMMD406]MDG4762970.1 hypothetical protein [Solwaraspora sp. WMMD406]
MALVDLVLSEGWQFTYLFDGGAGTPPATVEDMLSLRDEGGVQLKVWPVPGVLAIFQLYDAERIEFDVDLRELQGQQQLDVLCRFLTTIGRRLRKPVLMTPEGLENQPVLGYDVEADRVVLMAGR